MRFIETFKAERSNIFAVGLLEKIGALITPKSSQNKQIGIATLVIFIFFQLLQTLLALIFDGGFDFINFANTVLASFLGASSIFAVKSCHDYALHQIEPALLDRPLEMSFDNNLGQWFRNLVRWQWLGYFIFIFIGQSIICTIYFVFGMPFRFHFGTYLIISLLLGCLSQGAYWGIVSPSITNELIKANIKSLNLDPIFPHKSQSISGWSNILSRNSLWLAYGVTVLVIGFFLTKPNLIGSGAAIWLAISIFGYITTSYTFLLPQLNLSTLVQAQKRQTLNEIQQTLTQFYVRREELSKEDFERLEHLISLHKLVSEGQSNAIDSGAIRSLATSILLPSIAAFIGNAQNLSPGKFTDLINAFQNIFK